ncbi:MAG: hypothetical protein A3F78_21670 [Burkholderiales bacterium RIFCSPLOWO2_12_FULL_61_40]|nr:MAG: hypothetical protein A3F78_21670 [Burkholderiales bacterium RIFCSPLOWO2_12_FULL_61_40]
MKKTLIALAVLAASGASFAQVALTGNVTMGYQAQANGKDNVTASSEAAGFGNDTAEVNFVATEDIGGGYKATAKMSLGGITRAGAAGGQDATLTLATPVGALVLGTVKAADYLGGGLAGVGAYYSGWNGKVFSDRTVRDTVSYVVPVGAFTVTATYQEGATTGALGMGFGSNGAGAVTAQSLTGLSASYASGALNANGTYLQFASSNTGYSATKDQTRLSGNYDLGVAKLGAGIVVTNKNSNTAGVANPKVTDVAFGASMPMGAVTLGLNLVSRKLDDSLNAVGANISGTANGTSLQFDYALSKRTAVIGNYARWTQAATGIAAGQEASSQYQLMLSHSF